ncbi:hypothetical protein [Pseudooceanicola sp.]|uniref:hypothetical protein n=1 Tax=Pseudooceanicola sp. TaxID=1914328 RepID=UPI002609E378|nr:hypothetical protein [Pseudooceanicola sp.]MDF1855054.1 hypothetical protein [Pseudooceanicola sp.]
MSRPDGGHTCWVRLPSDGNALEIVRAAGEKGPLLVPGRVFSSKSVFENCFSLDLSAADSGEFETLLAQLGLALSRYGGSAAD